MKKIVVVSLIVVLSLLGCSSKTNIEAPKDKVKGLTINGEDYDQYGGADSYANAGDNKESRYYVNLDFYNMKSDDQLTIISNYKTFQQTTEWSCGNATALMVLWHFGKEDLIEIDIAKLMTTSVDEDIVDAQPGSANNFYEYGTNVKEMVEFFNNLDGFKVIETSYKETYTETDLLSEADGVTPSNYGNLKPTFSSSSLYASENSNDTEAWVEDAKDSYFVKWLTNHLKNNRPVMVEWGDWDGHWQTIIGYDNNGTSGIGDDILIFADSYDTSDHWQDGYYYYPLERFFFMWQDRSVAPKPYQIQPFLVVEKTK